MSASVNLGFRRFVAHTDDRVVELVDVRATFTPRIMESVPAEYHDPDWPWPGANLRFRGPDTCIGFEVAIDHGMRVIEKLLSQPFLIDAWTHHFVGRSLDSQYPWIRWWYAQAVVDEGKIICQHADEPRVISLDDGSTFEANIGGFHYSAVGPA